MKPLVLIKSTANFKTALDLMLKQKVHHLAVEESGRIIGTVSDRDLFYFWYKQKADDVFYFQNLTVIEAARTDCPILTYSTSLQQTLNWMQDFRTSILLYANSKEEWGTVTDSDLLNIFWQTTKQESFIGGIVTESEIKLASPLAQKTIELITQMGI